MKIIEKLKNRYNILIIILAIMMFALSFKLAILTIVEGDEYRNTSDNNRLKNIYVTPPRGEIRDRNGILLAGNKPSFTVQILKDELAIKNQEEKNEILLTLSRLLEEDGVAYVDDFPIDFNVFEFKNEEVYKSEDATPMDKVIDMIIENNLLPQILDTYYIHPDYQEHYQFITINKAINAIENKSVEVPITSKLNNGELIVSFDENTDIEKWKENHEIHKDSTPKESIIKLINQDKNIIRKTIDHPISRDIVFNILKDKGLNHNLVLKEYSLIYNEEHLQQKRKLMKDFKQITFETKAKDDFVHIVTETSLNGLLEKIVETEDSKGNIKKIIPGQVLIDKIEEKSLESPVKIEINEESNGVLYIHKDKKTDNNEEPIDSLIKFAKEKKLLEDFITDDDIKGIAQEVILSNGVNPKISIANWEYVSLVNRDDWFEKFNISANKNEEDIFADIKEYFKIDINLSNFEARTIMSLYDQLDKQGHRAYQPINIAYGIKNSTVAKIEEGLMETAGIQVSIEPIRHYPQGESAAHLLGYLGKISQASEIEEYVNKNKYSPNDIIGKTGIEEKFESQLKGESGIKEVEVDVVGNTTKVISEKKAVPGDNIYLTIDSNLQEVTEEALKRTLEEIQRGGTFGSQWGDYQFGTNREKGKPYDNATSGAVVVTNVKTGELLSMASYPAYDPNLFSTGISSSDWVSLFPENEKDMLAPRPLYNIATQTAIQPGSTFKMIPALAALEKGLSPTKTIRDMGKVDIGTSSYGCWLWNQSRSTHGPVNLYEALRDSCNYYFYSLVLGRNQKTGESLGMKVDIEDIMDLSKQLGLNDKTGIEIDIPSEASGGVPGPQKRVLLFKGLLEKFLNNNLSLYLKEDVDFEDEEIDDMIEEIISWTEETEPLSRGEVINRLDEMGVHPEKGLNQGERGIGDIIKFDYLDQVEWDIANSLIISIGQGENAFTPIQMTNAIATLVNGGYRHDVTAINSIKNFDNTKTLMERQVNPERIKLNNYENLEHIKLGMNKVATEGTAKRLYENFPVSVGAKTGTAQRDGLNPVTGEKYDNYAWFVAFAPYEEPEIAISVVLFQGGSGGYAGPITREIIAEYFGYNNMDENETLPMDLELNR